MTDVPKVEGGRAYGKLPSARGDEIRRRLVEEMFKKV